MRQLLLVSVLVFVGCASAGGNWMATNEGCNVWNPAPMSGETASWDGACGNGMAQGHGTVSWFQYGRTGNRVEGDYVNGRHEGKAVVRYPDGSVYEGYLTPDGGTRHGYGVLRRADGRVQAGVWDNGSLTSGGQNDGPSALERFGNWGKAYQDYERQNRGTNCTSRMQNGTVFTYCN